MAVSHLRNTPITGKSYTTPVDATAHSLELRYSQGGDPCSPQLGLVLRAQRADDVVLSRPVMVAKAWAEGCWDVSEGHIPTREWTTFAS